MKTFLLIVKNRHFATVAKLTLAAALLILIFYKFVDIGKLAEALKKAQWMYVLYALALQWCVVLIGTHRLQILLKAHSIKLSFFRVLKYNCIGYFFNLFSLGATGGDVVKAFYVSRETHEKKTESVTVVFLDRLMGMAAVVTIATAALFATLWLTDEFRQIIPFAALFMCGIIVSIILLFTKTWWTRFITFNQLIIVAVILLAGMCTAAIVTTVMKPQTFSPIAAAVAVSVMTVGIIILLTRRYWMKIDFIARLVNWGILTFVRIIDALHEYKSHKVIATVAFLDSLTLQVVMCFIALFLGKALGFDIDVYAYFIVFPIATLILTMPVTPSGLGTGETAFMVGFKHFGVAEDSSLAFAVLLRLIMLSMSAAGFIYWLLPGTHISRKQLAKEADALEDTAPAHLNPSDT